MAALLLLSVGLVLEGGVPADLPGVALGSPILWALEASALLFLLLLACTWALAESVQGRLPLLRLLHRLCRRPQR